MRKIVSLRWATLVVVSTLLLTSCGFFQGKEKTQAPKVVTTPTTEAKTEPDAPAMETPQKKLIAMPTPDTANAVEKGIVAKEGGSLSVKTGEGASVKIIFPQEALEKDATLEITPMTEALGGDILSNGFSLVEKGLSQGPTLKTPVIVAFELNGDLGKDISIVRVENDGTYSLIPTNVATKSGKTILTAQLPHFSTYMVKKVALGEKPVLQEVADFDWVIYMKDTSIFKDTVWDVSTSLDIRAVNTSGTIEGDYEGPASGTTASTMAVAGGTATGPFVMDGSLKFKLEPYFYLAPLVKPDSDLAPLVKPGEGPDFEGEGTLSLISKGMGKVNVGGLNVEKELSIPSEEHFKIYVTGPKVRMELEIPQGTMVFDGFIRGEGKKK